mmetsp:Transcript_18370/g.27610  ORF Transcript_18370/g.27610 Transcript_18370/m.27610 type:complete len:146 (+) Transcript_18370:198-635(+)
MPRLLLLPLLLLLGQLEDHGANGASAGTSGIGGYWTPLLGLKMAKCEEELTLLGVLWRRTIGLLLQVFTGDRSAERAHCEVKETHCPGASAVTGLEVRFGRAEATDRDLYDFKLRCGPVWKQWLQMEYPKVRPAAGAFRPRDLAL